MIQYKFSSPMLPIIQFTGYEAYNFVKEYSENILIIGHRDSDKSEYIEIQISITDEENFVVEFHRCKHRKRLDHFATFAMKENEFYFTDISESQIITTMGALVTINIENLSIKFDIFDGLEKIIITTI